ncbi:hypothetical protein AALO_G00021790 [Alosa alosa]|uniref:Uncharacterized protein n=1 Tax=Alosa alosa TaxID=278164 RepID=A0AAV6H9V1_9TELE|nr:hypothetical protein AALO_G00021790 [Alosa alosa]
MPAAAATFPERYWLDEIHSGLSIRPHKDLGILGFGFRDPLLTTTTLDHFSIQAVVTLMLVQDKRLIGPTIKQPGHQGAHLWCGILTGPPGNG